MKEIDDLIASKVGHILLTFIVLMFKGSNKFKESDFEEERFKDFVHKITKIQKDYLP